ncbi:MAG: outer membrane lipoprotein-sorting protein [bacterium]|nr:outer membrane lipoprotein-sorting protein [bacterium]
MKKFTSTLIALLLASLTLAGSLYAEDASEIMKKSHLAYYYSADDGVAEVSMSIVDKKGKERIREFTMLRMDETDGGAQKYYTYFRKPSDVSRLTFMVHKNPDASDARWIYVPAVDLVKPISADDKNSSFVGSDFSYEDVSGRHWSEDTHTLVKDSTLDGAAVFVIESIPLEEYSGFARKVTFVDKASYLPLREEYYDNKDKLRRIFLAEKLEEVDGFLTVTQRSMQDVKKDRKTTIVFSSIAYNQGLGDDLFSERYLKNPPREFIK